MLLQWKEVFLTLGLVNLSYSEHEFIAGNNILNLEKITENYITPTDNYQNYLILTSSPKHYLKEP